MVEKIKNFIKNSDGWERMWLLICLLMLIPHLLILFLSFPSSQYLYKAPSNTSQIISLENEWLDTYRDNCIKAEKSVNQEEQKLIANNVSAKKSYEDELTRLRAGLNKSEEKAERYRRLGNDNAEAAADREWSSYKYQIDNLQEPVNKLFSLELIQDPEVRDLYQDCNAHLMALEDARKKKTKEAEANSEYWGEIFKNSFYALLTYVLLSGFMYLIIIGIGWIIKGFKKK